MGEWISVKDRLPEELTPVIAFTEAIDQGICIAFRENGLWIDGDSGHGIVLIQQGLVTHWMPLPDPPEDPQL